jgi:histidyl-tRNA synthetase
MSSPDSTSTPPQKATRPSAPTAEENEVLEQYFDQYFAADEEAKKSVIENATTQLNQLQGAASTRTWAFKQFEDVLKGLKRKREAQLGKGKQPATTTTAASTTTDKMKGRGGMIDVNPVAGTRDFPPSEMRLRKWLFDKFHTVAKQFGFEEYDAPILEPEELYTRKGGEEITQQMYNFKDKSEQPVALRPEMTPSLARLILSQGKALLLPVKWYSIPQCWRYETTVRGRKREHFQWNMDIWGINSANAEAELLAAIVALFKSVGLTPTNIGIKVSSRKVIQSILDSLKVKQEVFAETCIIIDKLDKLERADVLKQLSDLGITEEVGNEIIDSMQMKSVDDLEKKLGSNHEAVKELKTLFSLAKGYGYEDWLIFDASIVRGLAYYTGIVFEAFSKDTELQRAICGGGRYDRILTTYKAKQDIPACGFGFGDIVILEVLRDKGLIPADVTKHVIDDLVIPFNDSMRPDACRIVSQLRDAGRIADVYMGNTKKPASAFSYADRVGADRAIFIAPDEWAKDCVNIKYLRLGDRDSQKQYTVPVSEILTFVPPDEESNSQQ